MLGGQGEGGEWTLLAEEITWVKVLEAEVGGVTDLWGQSESHMEAVPGDEAQEVGKGCETG